MGGGGQSVDPQNGIRCLARVQTVKARLKVKSEAMQVRFSSQFPTSVSSDLLELRIHFPHNLLSSIII